MQEWSNACEKCADAIARKVLDLQASLPDDVQSRLLLEQLLHYVLRQWINKSTTGPGRLTVRDNAARTNNVLESFHASLRRRMKVAHSNLYAFLGHLQRVTMDNQADVTRLDRGLHIRRPKKRGVL